MLLKDIQKMLFHNLYLKIFSILFGILIFIAIQLSQGKDIIQTVKFTLSLSIPDGYQLSTPFPDEVSVLVRGPKKKLLRLVKQERFLSIEAKRSKIRTLGREDFPLLNNLEIVKIIPATLNISIEPTAEKPVPVVLNRMKHLPPHLIYQKTPEVTPGQVTLIGPRSYLNLIDQVYTQPLDQSRLKKSGQVWVKLRRDHPLIHFKNLQSVRVNYTIKERLIKRGIPDIFITYLNGDPETLMFRKDLPVEVVVEAPYHIAKTLKSSDFQAFIDLKGSLQEGEMFKRSLTIVTARDQVKILYILPEEIVFRQKRTEKKVKSLSPKIDQKSGGNSEQKGEHKLPEKSAPKKEPESGKIKKDDQKEGSQEKSSVDDQGKDPNLKDKE